MMRSIAFFVATLLFATFVFAPPVVAATSTIKSSRTYHRLSKKDLTTSKSLKRDPPLKDPLLLKSSMNKKDKNESSLSISSKFAGHKNPFPVSPTPTYFITTIAPSRHQSKLPSESPSKSPSSGHLSTLPSNSQSLVSTTSGIPTLILSNLPSMASSTNHHGTESPSTDFLSAFPSDPQSLVSTLSGVPMPTLSNRPTCSHEPTAFPSTTLHPTTQLDIPFLEVEKEKSTEASTMAHDGLTEDISFSYIMGSIALLSTIGVSIMCTFFHKKYNRSESDEGEDTFLFPSIPEEEVENSQDTGIDDDDERLNL